MADGKDSNPVKIEIYDPPMCCPGGLCGPDPDTAVLDINEAILKINKEFDEKVNIVRYLLNQQGARFMQVPEIMSRIKEFGIDILPITMVNGRVVKEKDYPSYDELKTYLVI